MGRKSRPKRGQNLKLDPRTLRKKEEHLPKPKNWEEKAVVNESTGETLATKDRRKIKLGQNNLKKRHGHNENNHSQTGSKIPSPPVYSDKKIKEMSQKKRLLDLNKLAVTQSSSEPRMEETTRQNQERESTDNGSTKQATKCVGVSLTGNLHKNLIEMVCEESFIYPAKKDFDMLTAPVDDAVQLLRKFNEYHLSASDCLLGATVQKNATDENYIHLLGESRRYDGLIQSIYSRRKRKQNKLGYRIQIVQIKLLNIIYQQMVGQCKNAFHQSKLFMKQAKRFGCIISRVHRNCRRMSECVQTKRIKIAEKKRVLEEVKKQIQETNEQFEQVNHKFEEVSKTSDEYQTALQTFNRLMENTKQVGDVIQRDQNALYDLRRQLDDTNGRTKRFQQYMAEVTKKREMFEQRKKLWKRRDTIQESLKEIIRMKTGIVLREENIQNRITKSIKDHHSYKTSLQQQLSDLKFQKRKLMFKYQNYCMLSNKMYFNPQTFPNSFESTGMHAHSLLMI